MKKAIFMLILFLSMQIFAQEKEHQLTGILSLDFHNSSMHLNQASLNDSLNIMVDKKSPFLSGVMSAAIPGAGQIYNGDYWKTAIFIAVEAAAIYAVVHYNQKGDDQTAFFENYAHENWSVNQYAEWSRDHAERISGRDFTDEEENYYNTALINNEGVVSWDVLNDLEHRVGKWYSHRLAPFGDQQYYEMIGKYPQFVSGWNDFYEEYPDGIFNYPQDKVTSKFSYYTSERGKANDFYSKAKTATTIIIVNHLISAVEAAWTTSRNNKTLDVNVSMAQHNYGYVTDYYPQMNLSYNF